MGGDFDRDPFQTLEVTYSDGPASHREGVVMVIISVDLPSPHDLLIE